MSVKLISSVTAGIAVAAAAFGLAAVSFRRSDPNKAAAERAAVPDGMVYVPAGDFIAGTDDADADEDVRPARRAFVPSFYIDRTEVTNAEYRRFRPDHAFPPGENRLPVTNVTYDDAAAYAKWAGKRLPAEEEWEKAARGTDGHRFPWGNTWDPTRVAKRASGSVPASASRAGTSAGCAIGPSRVRSVGQIPAGTSPNGCLDMAGNAWEWVQGFYRGNPDQRILRGGAVGYGERACRAYHRAIEGSGAT